MRRTNTFRLRPAPAQERHLVHLAEGCAALFNEANYKRRQSFFAGHLDMAAEALYQKYKTKLGSVTTQQIIRKNSEAWCPFLRC